MRNLKKFLALVLATLMVVSAAATVSAYAVFDDVEDGNPYAEAIGTLVEYGITKGIGESLFGADLPVQRYQMALFIARALAPNEDWNGEGAVIFPDVKEYTAAIAFVNNKGIVNGMPDGTFAPDAQIKYQDALLMILRTLGYTVDTSCTPYWVNAYKMAKELGLTDNVNISENAVFAKDNYLNRSETAQIIFNLLNAKPADGGLTIAQKNFGAEVVEPEPEEPDVKPVADGDTYVITVTPLQSYVKDVDKDVLDLDYVGVQPLENGIPDGDVKYISIDTLGIAKADVENYFNYSVVLYNVAEDNSVFITCDSAELCDAPTPAFTAEISKVSGTKFKYGGVTYTVTDEYTDSSVRNEIMIFNGSTASSSAMELIVNAKGEVLKDGKTVASLVTLDNGTKVYYATAAGIEMAGEGYEEKYVYTEAEAKAMFGVKLSDNIVFTTLDLSDLNYNYKLDLFDDNDDGKFDRAFLSEVYMSAYKAPKDGACQIDGLKDLVVKAGYADKKGVKGLDDLVAGNVFTYTYNGKTNTVNVIDILEEDNGVVTQITPKKYAADPLKGQVYYVVTIDGEDFVLANEDRSANGYIGAKVFNSNVAFDNIAKDGSMSYVDWKDIAIGFNMNFIKTANNEIIAGKSDADPAESHDIVIIKGAKTVDDDKNLIVDAYVNGKLEEIKVSQIGDKKFADLSDFGFTSEVNALVGSTVKLGAIFQGKTNSDGTVKLTTAYYEDTNIGTTDSPKVVKGEFANKLPTDGTVTFTDGIADTIVKDNKSAALRTSSSTIFLFISEEDEKIEVYNGVPANNKEIYLNNAAVYTDKFGYGTNDKVNGVAGIVVVVCKDKVAVKTATNFFNDAAPDYYTIMLLNESDVVNYVRASGATFGLKGTDIYQKYTVNAINLNDGTPVTEIYLKEGSAVTELAKGGVYKVDKVTKVVSALAVKDTDYEVCDVELGNFTEARNWTISKLPGYTKLTKLSITDIAKYDPKAAPKDVIAAGQTWKLTFAKATDTTKVTTFIAVAESYGTKDIEVKVEGLNEGETAKVTLTVNSEATNKSFEASDTVVGYTFKSLDKKKDYNVDVEVEAGRKAVITIDGNKITITISDADTTPAN